MLFFGYLEHLFPNLFKSCKLSDFKCDTCVLVKSHRTTYPDSFSRRYVPFDLVHSDVWGPSRITSTSGFRWFVIFIDDCTRMTWRYLMKYKSDGADRFRAFHKRFRHNFRLI